MSEKIFKKDRLLKYTASQLKTDRRPSSKATAKEVLVVCQKVEQFEFHFVRAFKVNFVQCLRLFVNLI